MVLRETVVTLNDHKRQTSWKSMNYPNLEAKNNNYKPSLKAVSK